MSKKSKQKEFETENPSEAVEIENDILDDSEGQSANNQTPSDLADDETKLESCDDVQKLTQDLENSKKIAKDAQDKASEYLSLAQRVQAEFDNYRRRNADIAKNSRQDGIASSVEALLPVVDTITSAKQQVKDEEFLKSLDLIYKQTLSCFEKLGVTKIEAVGKPFDPNFQNCILTEHVDGVDEDIVLEEYQQGFMLDGKVIRHSVVKVSK